MNQHQSMIAARGLTDGQDRLVKADELLAELQEACGGRLPGPLAVPDLRELVRQSRELGMRIAREFSAFDGEEMVAGFVRVRPSLDPDDILEGGEGGCEILIENWQSFGQSQDSDSRSVDHLDACDRAAAEVSAYLDAQQNLQFIVSASVDTFELQNAFSQAPGQHWSRYISLEGIAHEQPLHWRLLDAVKANIPGSARTWRARLLPKGETNQAPRGFELLLIANEPLDYSVLALNVGRDPNSEPEHSRLIGSALTPVLRQPISRIIANAETIHARLAGPLRDEYSEYAANIAAAGQHLAGMLDDLADLEVVEAPNFQTAKERVDLVDVAKRAAGILGVRAQARAISIAIEETPEPVYANAEFRRVLQILINLIGNAIAYSPTNSDVSVHVAIEDGEGQVVSVIVSDQGPGITTEQASRIFEKFERLGRDSDGGNDTGSGLGLFISRKLARAMEGDLQVLPPDTQDELLGAQFKLILPALKPR